MRIKIKMLIDVFYKSSFGKTPCEQKNTQIHRKTKVFTNDLLSFAYGKFRQNLRLFLAKIKFFTII